MGNEFIATVHNLRSIKELRKAIKRHILECFDEVLTETQAVAAVKAPFDVELELDSETREIIAEEVVDAIEKELLGEEDEF